VPLVGSIWFAQPNSKTTKQVSHLGWPAFFVWRSPEATRKAGFLAGTLSALPKCLRQFAEMPRDTAHNEQATKYIVGDKVC